MYLVTQIVHLFIPVFICAYMLSANIEYYVPHIQYTKEFKVKPLSSDTHNGMKPLLPDKSIEMRTQLSRPL